MNERLKKTLLYDFYGELLTEHQKEMYEQYLLEDLSLAEIAAEAGISRQGVHDVIKRCTNLLNGYEDKLQLVEKFLMIREKIEEINRILEDCEPMDHQEVVQRIRTISQDIIEEL